MAKQKMNWAEAELGLYKRIADLAMHPSPAGDMEIALKLAPLVTRLRLGEQTEELYELIVGTI